MSKELKYKAVLVDYDEDLFTPTGSEGEILAQAGIAWVAGQHRTPEKAGAIARDADVVMVQSVRPLLTRDVIETLEKCRCIVRVGIGYDSVDVDAATERGILVCNVPLYCVEDVADHALALLTASVRHVARQDRWIRDGRWDRTGAKPARRIKGCTIGFVGFGRIGRAVAQRVQGFGMTRLAFDPYLDGEAIASCGVEKVGLDELLQRSDFISVHAPLTDETHHLLGSREFGLMKDGVFLVNTSRGPLVDQTALAEALKSGKVSGAGLDVVEEEPLPLDSPLRDLDNVTLTPHVGANSEESREELYATACRIAINVVNGIRPEEVVNPEAEGKTAYRYP